MTRPDAHRTALLPPMKWNAWGDPAEAKPLSDGIRSLLEQALGVTGSAGPELQADDVQLRPSSLSDADRDALTGIVGSDHCHTDARAPAESRRWTCSAAATRASRTRPTRCCCPVATRK
jgi:alkyldihydroxyacetonephosphate synthase